MWCHFYILPILTIIYFNFIFDTLFVKAEYFSIELVRIQTLNESTNLFSNRDLRVTKYNHSTAAINGGFELLMELDENFEISIEMYLSVSGNNQFSKTPFRIPKTSVCNFMNTTYRQYFMEEFKMVSNFPTENQLCPIKPDVYWVKNYACDMRELRAGKNGMWRLDMDVWKNQIIIGGCQLFIKLTSNTALWD